MFPRPRGEVTLFLIKALHPLLVFFEFGRIVRFGEDVFEENGPRNADGVEIFHGSDYGPVIENLVALNGDVPHLHLGPFGHLEYHFHGRGRNLAQFRFNGRILAAAFGEIFLQNDGGALYFIGVILRFNRQPDTTLLEAIENLGNSYRFGAIVLNRTNDTAFDNDETENIAGAAFLALQRNVVKAA